MRQDRETFDLFGEPESVETAPVEAAPLEPTMSAPRTGVASAPSRSVAPDDQPEVPHVEDPEARAPTKPQVWTVSEVNRSVKEMLEDFLPPVWITGEIANWTAHRSGHRYFTLKDDQAQIRCVMFRSDARRLPIDPEDGMNVKVFGTLTLYEARGEYQLTVRQLEARDADGLWRLAFEKTRRKLEAEGLLDPARKRPLPRWPRTVGIVTSMTGAALEDILTVLRRRAPWTRVLVRSCRVQGEGAALEVADAIRVMAASRRADVLIVGRGGGSIEDLWAFNEEVVARAIAACPLPVVSAVGHEVDVTIADLVADVRAPTPSAAAALVVQDGRVVQDALRALPARFSRALRAAVERRHRRIADAGGRLERGMRGRLSPLRQRAERCSERMERITRRRVERRREALASLAGRLDALSPLSILGRGYAVAQDGSGHLLSRVADFSPGLPFRLRVADGAVDCESKGGTS